MRKWIFAVWFTLHMGFSPFFRPNRKRRPTVLRSTFRLKFEHGEVAELNALSNLLCRTWVQNWHLSLLNQSPSHWKIDSSSEMTDGRSLRKVGFVLLNRSSLYLFTSPKAVENLFFLRERMMRRIRSANSLSVVVHSLSI